MTRRAFAAVLSFILFPEFAIAAEKPTPTIDTVCRFYGEAAQAAAAWDKDGSCSIPKVELLDTNFHQTDFICCGGGATSSATNRDIPAGLELRVTGSHYWSIAAPLLVGNQFSLHTYCGPEPFPGPGCNVKVDVLAHYRAISQAPSAAKVAPAAGSAQQESSKSNAAHARQAAESETKAPSPFYQSIGMDKLLAFCFGVFFALILLVIAIFDRKPSPIGILIYRVLLALVAAGVGAVLPGTVRRPGTGSGFRDYHRRACIDSHPRRVGFSRRMRTRGWQQADGFGGCAARHALTP